MYVIETQGLTKSYGSIEEVCVHALRGVELHVQEGELLAIMGPSGSGKSTLLHILGGVEVPTSGQVLLEGVDLALLNDDERTILRRERMGFIFQSFNLLPAFTAEENISLPMELSGIPSGEARRRSLDMLKMVGMTHRRHHIPSTLSGGEQQRVAIARAIVDQPDILIMDEPTASLDGDTGVAILSFVRKNVLNKDRCIVVVTHDDRIYQFATRILKMEDGRLKGSEKSVA